MGVYMKVADATVMTGSICIRESKVLRRLQVNDILEILEGPKYEETAKVMRVRGKVLAPDNTEGWITMAGNQGTVYLKETYVDPLEMELEAKEKEAEEAQKNKAQDAKDRWFAAFPGKQEIP